MKRRSLRTRLSLWMTLLMTLVVGLSFLAIRWTSNLILSAVNRDYLLDAVEENAGMVRFLPEAEDSTAFLYIPYGEGYLAIDTHFLREMGDVQAGLYGADGTLLYGENPLAKQTGTTAFKETKIWRFSHEGAEYLFYDRALSECGIEGLWLRGVISEGEVMAPLRTITRLSLILFPILILLAALLQQYLLEKELKSLQQMEATARHISRGEDLKERVPLAGDAEEIASLTESFNRMLDRLDNAFEAERRFTSDASHELRTPTSVVLAQTEYILERPRSAEEYREALEVVDKQGRRMKQLIDDMLDYTRMDMAAERYPLSELDFSALTRECAGVMAPQGEGAWRYEIRVEEGMIIMGHEGLLLRLLQNLISNALRYGDPEGWVRVVLKRESRGIILSVKDDGPGIPPEEQEKIFERFYRSDSARSSKGTGLGLALVKKIAQIHGAVIELESEVGAGSCFRVIFPQKNSSV